MNAAPAPLRIALLHFSPRKLSSNARVMGYAHVSLLDAGFTIYGVKLIYRRDEVFAFLPERVLLDADLPVRDECGRIEFRRTMRFHDDARFIEFSKAVVAEVRRVHPEAFEIEPGQHDMQAAAE